ncbi:MAG: glycosyltransferase family 2 protein [Thermoanaerobaculia bacterium]
MTPDPVVIAVPAYNAGVTLEKTLGRIPAGVAGEARLLVVDDGSTDDTAEALARAGAAFPSLVVLRHSKNRGYGAAVKTLLTHALSMGAGTVVILHADGQYSPERIPELLAPLKEGSADLVQGSRMLAGGALSGGMPFYKYAANKLLTFLENRAFGMRLAEFHSGYMLYSRATLAAIPYEGLSDSFDFDLEMIVCARILGLRIAEVAIPTIYAGEVSHLDPIGYGLDVLAVVRRYRRGRYHDLLGVERTNRRAAPRQAVEKG